jgi:hypothetical protein
MSATDFVVFGAFKLARLLRLHFVEINADRRWEAVREIAAN